MPKTFRSPLRSRIHSIIKNVWKGLASYEGLNRVAKKVIWNAITATFAALPHNHEKRFAHPVNQLCSYVSSFRDDYLLFPYQERSHLLGSQTKCPFEGPSGGGVCGSHFRQGKSN